MKSIFVSSTFRDFEKERDILRNSVQPRLNMVASRYGEYVDFCDLRWGIAADGDSLVPDSGKILHSCLDQIDRSAPFFIALLGDRYGFMPGPDEIRHETARRVGFYLEDYDISVTQLEIEYGLLRGYDNSRKSNTLVYFRRNAALEVQILEDETHRDKLEQLMQRLVNLMGEDIRFFDGGNEEDLHRFADMLYDDLLRRLELGWKKYAAITPREQRQLVQWNYLEEKLRYISTNTGFCDSLVRKIMTSRVKCDGILLRGGVGTGKTTVFSYVCREAAHRGWTVFSIFCGTTPMYTDIDGIEQELIALKTDRRRVLIGIDGLDQIVASYYRIEEALTRIARWDGVRLLVTATEDFAVHLPFSVVSMPIPDGDGKQTMIQRILRENGKELSVDVLSCIMRKAGAGNPLYLYLLISRLCVFDEQDYSAIQSKGNDYHAILQHQIETVDSLPEDPESLSQELLSIIAKRIGNRGLYRACQYIAASRYGLRLKDLENILQMECLSFSPLQFAQLTNYLSEMFILRRDGRYDFMHKCLRKGVMAACDDSQVLHRTITRYLLSLSDEDIVYINNRGDADFTASEDFLLRKKEIAYHMFASREKEAFHQYLFGYFDGDAMDIFLDELKKYCLTNGEGWLTDILDIQRQGLQAAKETSVSLADPVLREAETVASIVFQLETAYLLENECGALELGERLFTLMEEYRLTIERGIDQAEKLGPAIHLLNRENQMLKLTLSLLDMMAVALESQSRYREALSCLTRKTAQCDKLRNAIDRLFRMPDAAFMDFSSMRQNLDRETKDTEMRIRTVSRKAALQSAFSWFRQSGR